MAESGGEHRRAARAYAQSFEGDERVAKHMGKFERRLERVRDLAELKILNRHLAGEVFDCSVGFGRLVGRLGRVTRYAGMDISQSFVDHVRRTHPQVEVERGDLLEGIDQPDDRYDAVICLRTLPVLPDLPGILAEMIRIARPGGIVLASYGTQAVESAIAGHAYRSSAYDLRQEGARLGLREEAVYLKDRLAMAIKERPRCLRLFESRLNLIPESWWAAGDLALSRRRGGPEVVAVWRVPR